MAYSDLVTLIEANPNWALLNNDDCAAAVNAQMITSPTAVLVPLWQVKLHGMEDGWWMVGQASIGTNPYATAWFDYYNDPRFENVDLTLPTSQTILAGLVSTGVITQANSDAITAMSTPQVLWTSVYWSGPVGGGHIGSARAMIAGTV